MGTKLNPGAFDCYANAEPDEPMFILLARDRHAPELVRWWAEMRAHDGESPAKVKEAVDCSAAMERWRTEHRPAAARPEESNHEQTPTKARAEVADEGRTGSTLVPDLPQVVRPVREGGVALGISPLDGAELEDIRLDAYGRPGFGMARGCDTLQAKRLLGEVYRLREALRDAQQQRTKAEAEVVRLKKILEVEWDLL